MSSQLHAGSALKDLPTKQAHQKTRKENLEKASQ
jgi:hypothetical protein